MTTKNRRSMNSIILFEGVDNSGKTTALNYVKDQLEKLGLHPNVYHCDQNTCWADYYQKTSKGLWLCDRSHIGDFVYSPIYRGVPGACLKRLTNATVLFFNVSADASIFNDDNLSLTKDLTTRELEINLFKQTIALMNYPTFTVQALRDNTNESVWSCVKYILDLDKLGV